ncbi:MAG: hypothetical protein D4R73_03640 [Deltaproteobacteria bacterium]|nr:MAG: hypothetical protein D4R73_03640 [Deltaproteobacteria bacterium]
MISPTLFIGLGTQGLRILEELQKLVIEEYGEKPAIFEYIYLETDQDARPQVQSWARDEIRVPQPFPVIHQLSGIKSDYEQGTREYLRPWINESLFTHPDGAFTAGAGHIRMAGRLCLWANWDTCAQVINDAYQKANADINKTNTLRFLQDFYRKVNRDIKPDEKLMGDNTNFYIFGTLCGGTCGGMFIDVAYMIREKFGVKKKKDEVTPRLKGIFTILDHNILSNPRHELDDKRAANCWASLMELDYYSHPVSQYQAVWPESQKVSNSNPPFDYVYILSCSGNHVNLRLPGSIPAPDLGALNHTAAMVLFSETVSDLFSEKQKIIINFAGHPKVNKPYSETPEGSASKSTSEDMPIFAACGLCAVWYPKYRIAEAGSCHVAKQICQEWQGVVSTEAQQRIEKEEVPLAWQEILRSTLPTLTKKPQGSIENEIRDWFDKNHALLMGKSNPDMVRELRRELEKLGEGQEHDKEITREDRLLDFKRALKEALREQFLRVVNTTSNLAYAGYFLKRLDLEIKDTIDRLPAKYPRPEFSMVDQAENEALKVDHWARFVFRNKIVAMQKKEDFLSDCQDYFLECLMHVRNFQARPILEEIRKYLGVEIQPAPEERIQTLRQEMDDLKNILGKAIGKMEETIQNLSETVVVPQNMQVIYESMDNSIEDDIRNLRSRLYNLYRDQKDAVIRKMMSVREGSQQIVLPLYDFIKTRDKLTEAMINDLRLRALDLIGRFNIAKRLTDREDAEILRRFARRAEPLLEWGGATVNVDNPHFMIGNDDPGAPNLKRLHDQVLNNPTSQNRVNFGTPTESPLLDHLLIFYQEKGLLYKNENFATADLFQQKYKRLAQTEKYGLFTHKLGELAFDPLLGKRRKEAEDMLGIIGNLIFYQDLQGQWQESQIIMNAQDRGLTLNMFRIERNALFLRFKVKDGTDATLLANDSGAASLARDPYSFAVIKGEVVRIMAQIRNEGCVEMVNDHLQRMELELVRQNEPPENMVKKLQEERERLAALRNKYLSEKPA